MNETLPPSKRPIKILAGFLLSVAACGAVTAASFYVLGRGSSEARVLSACVDIPASAERVASPDLASLGLRPAGQLDPSAIYGEGFVDGAVVQYSSGGEPAAVVAVLRFADASDASAAFGAFQEWAQGSCGLSSWANLGATGVVHCRVTGGADLVLWKDDWILDIEAADLEGVPGEELASQIKEAVVAHWQGLSDGS